MTSNHLILGLSALFFSAMLQGITFGGLLFFGFQKNFKNENIPKLIIGFVSGILGGAVAMSGPPIVLFLTNKREKKNSFRVNLPSTMKFIFC